LQQPSVALTHRAAWLARPSFPTADHGLVHAESGRDIALIKPGLLPNEPPHFRGRQRSLSGAFDRLVKRHDGMHHGDGFTLLYTRKTAKMRLHMSHPVLFFEPSWQCADRFGLYARTLGPPVVNPEISIMCSTWSTEKPGRILNSIRHESGSGRCFSA